MTIHDKIKDETLQYNINKEAAKILFLSSGRINKIWISYRWGNTTSWWKKCDRKSYVYLFSFRKSFCKINKNDWRARKKQTDAITNTSKRLAALTNKDDDHKDNYKKILEEIVKEKFDKIKELTNETNQNDLIYY